MSIFIAVAVALLGVLIFFKFRKAYNKRKTFLAEKREELKILGFLKTFGITKGIPHPDRLPPFKY